MMKLLDKLLRRKRVVTTLRAVITRADGTVEDLGVISRTESKAWKVKANG